MRDIATESPGAPRVFPGTVYNMLYATTAAAPATPASDPALATAAPVKSAGLPPPVTVPLPVTVAVKDT